jgi:PAS domain S-box-containing protein
MAQKPIELILMRQLAGSLATPVFLVDEVGTLIYYNESAERVLGMRFEETGEMPASEWTTRWQPADDRGVAIPPERLPLAIAVAQERPAHGEFSIQGANGARRHVAVTGIPLVGHDGSVLGAAAFFWETGK